MNLEQAIELIIAIGRVVTSALILVTLCALLGAVVISLTL